MLSRTRIFISSIVVALSFAGASLVPGAAQAQWHNYCVAGHCVTHSNYTLGGVDPCTAINSQSDNADKALDNAEKEKAAADGMPQGGAKDAAESRAQSDIAAAEGQLHQADIAAFEWGCDTTGLHTT